MKYQEKSMNAASNHVVTNGLAFVEFSGNKPHLLLELFDKMGFHQAGNITDTPITIHTQGNIRFISNPSNGGNAEKFRSVHGRGASAMGFRVDNSEVAFTRAIELGAKAADITDYDIPAIKGVGQSLIYLIDSQKEELLLKQFQLKKEISNKHTSLIDIDHLTHNLGRGTIQKWINFYETVFGFKRVRRFEIQGKKTGLYSEVVASKCGRLKIPLNESKDEYSQIEEFIKEYNGEGIQHIAFNSTDIYKTVQKISKNNIPFQYTPDTYYELINTRQLDHNEDIQKLRDLRILIDGGPKQGGGTLLQIFTKNSIGPIFFEFIQRKGNEGFGEGNFQALFESIELDQMRRGVL